jgi:tRNA dimethylallyltransferase
LSRPLFEIVSADSVQVYRYLDIGSAKPSAFQRSLVPHHLIDIVEPDEVFTAGEFCRRAEAICGGIAGRGKIPLFVGGTGLYIDSFFKGLSEVPEVSDDVKRALRNELADKGLGFLYKRLLEADPVFASRVHGNDRQRILRGLEVYISTGKPLSSYFNTGHARQSLRTLYIGLRVDRHELRNRIDKRIDKMMGNGFIEEVVSLRERGYGPDLASMKSIGYREIHEYLDGLCSREEAVERMKISTAQYAKRQMTWFGKNPDIHWFDNGSHEGAVELIGRWIENNK